MIKLRVDRSLIICGILAASIFAWSKTNIINKKITNGVYVSMAEFGDEWEPSLNKAELDLLEPDRDGDKLTFKQAKFKKDGTLRGIFCQKNTIVNIVPKENIIFFSTRISNTNIERPEPICKFNDFIFSGVIAFRRNDFALKTIEFLPKSKINGVSYEIGGLKFKSMRMYFDSAKIVEKRMASSPFKNLSYYIISADIDQNSPMELIISRSGTANGILFTPGMRVNFLGRDTDYSEEQLDFVVLPDSQNSIKVEGIDCKQKVYFSGNRLAECNVARPVRLGKLEIPAETSVIFNANVQKSSKALPYVIYDWPAYEKLGGHTYDNQRALIIRNGKLISEGAENLKNSLQNSRVPHE